MPDLHEELAAILDADWEEGSTSLDVATALLRRVRRWDADQMTEAAPPIRPGLAFKTPWSSSVHHVRWMDGDLFWIVTGTSRYGWLGTVTAQMWQTITEAKIQAKTAEKMTQNEEGLTVGTKLKWKQGQIVFDVLAVSPKSALMRTQGGKLYVEPNEHLIEHYRPI